MNNYTQNNEQAHILAYLDNAKISYKNLTFLDIGANDGKTFSSTMALYELGARGVCVEPSNDAYAMLLQNQPESVNVIAAIANTDGDVEFYESGTHLGKGDVSLVSTILPGEMRRWKHSGEQFTKKIVPGITLKTLMSNVPYSTFDFVSIDVEGFDLDVLRQLVALGGLGCRLLCVETNSQNDPLFAAEAGKIGLKQIHKTYENLIFAKKPTAPQTT